MKKWKKIGTQQILDHPRLTVFEDEIELPDGSKTTYLHFGDAKHGSTVITQRGDGKILLQKEFSYPPNQWLYQFPGGGLKGDETPVDAAVRELAEEAGLAGDFHQIGWFYADSRRKMSKLFVFLATNLTETVGKKDIEEHFIEYWLTSAEISKLISAGQIVNSFALAAWAIFKEKSE